MTDPFCEYTSNSIKREIENSDRDIKGLKITAHQPSLFEQIEELLDRKIEALEERLRNYIKEVKC